MTQDQSSSETPKPAKEIYSPGIAIKRFKPLVGKWALKGRTLTAQEDNVSGWTTFEWMPGGYFLKSESEITIKGILMQHTEIITHDHRRNTFPSNVYTNMWDIVFSYEWDIQDNILTHWWPGSKYTGIISADGNTITGGWRAAGEPSTDSASYDVVMSRLA